MICADFFSTATLSFSADMEAHARDESEISAKCLGAPLVNSVVIADTVVPNVKIL